MYYLQICVKSSLGDYFKHTFLKHQDENNLLYTRMSMLHIYTLKLPLNIHILNITVHYSQNATLDMIKHMSKFPCHEVK